MRGILHGRQGIRKVGRVGQKGEDNPGSSADWQPQSVSGVLAVERAAEIFVDGRGAAREGFVRGALAIRTAALAAFSSLLVFFKTKGTMQSSITASRAWRG